MQPVPIHKLRGNAREWSPPHLVFLDTETRATATVLGEDHVMRLWVARAVDRRQVVKPGLRDAWADGDTPGQLAAQVDAWTRNRGTTWLYAHNLAFDLATSMLPVLLTRAGWTVTQASLGGKACWLRLTRSNRTLTMADSWSWWPAALEAIAEGTRASKVALPAPDAPRGAWLARCRTDVQVLSEAVLALIDWWDRNKLGNWKETGAGCGWNMYRHHPQTGPVVIHPDPAVMREDRLTVHGGRRSVWTCGLHAAGPFLELDFTAAYPTVAAYLPLPVQHRAAFDSLSADDHRIGSELFAPAAWCHIRADTPGLPARFGSRVWYPTGEWWAYLAAPEIAAAREAGQLVEIGPGRMHQLGNSMQAWARDILRLVRPGTPGVPEVARMAAKHWSRAVIGKWASHAYITEPLGHAPDTGWSHEDAWDVARNCRAAVTDIAGRRYVVSSGGDPENSYPAIFGWVESYTRVRLNRALALLGPGCVLQCNTDGLIVAERTLATRAARGSLVAVDGTPGAGRVQLALNAINRAVWPLQVRVKATHEHVDIRGPQHVRTPAQRMLSGVPRTATETESDTFTFTDWPQMASVLQRGLDGTYRRRNREVHMRGPWPSGWLLASGAVLPVQMATAGPGANRILPWRHSVAAQGNDSLADVQRPELDALR